MWNDVSGWIEPRRPADRALVRAERVDLLVRRRADVEPNVRVARAEQQHPRDTMVLQAIPQLFRKEEMIARGDDAIECAPSRDAVVGMHLVVAPGIVRKDNVGPMLADHPAELAPQ